MLWIAPPQEDTDSAAHFLSLRFARGEIFPNKEFNSARPEGLLDFVFPRCAKVHFAAQRAKLKAESAAPG